jgi:hypothetical protein
MDKCEAGTVVGPDAFLEVRVELVDSEPDIWRLFEIRGSMVLNQVHQVLQAAFGWEERTCTGSQQAIRSRRCGRLTAKSQKPCSGSPSRNAKHRKTGQRRYAPLISCSRWAQARHSMNTTLATAGSTGSSWYTASPRGQRQPAGRAA